MSSGAESLRESRVMVKGSGLSHSRTAQHHFSQRYPSALGHEEALLLFHYLSRDLGEMPSSTTKVGDQLENTSLGVI